MWKHHRRAGPAGPLHQRIKRPPDHSDPGDTHRVLPGPLPGEPGTLTHLSLCPKAGRLIFIILSFTLCVCVLQTCIVTHESNGIDIITALILNDISPLCRYRMEMVLQLKVCLTERFNQEGNYWYERQHQKSAKCQEKNSRSLVCRIVT